MRIGVVIGLGLRRRPCQGADAAFHAWREFFRSYGKNRTKGELLPGSNGEVTGGTGART